MDPFPDPLPDSLLDASFSRRLEAFARPYMTTLAHQPDHIERVRKWALAIARAEQFAPLAWVEAAAMLHDIGLRDGGTRLHAQVGADLAAEFLEREALFDADGRAQIVYAIRMHSSLEGQSSLLHILQDADMLEVFGAVGLARAFVSRHSLPLHEPAAVRGQTWGMRAEDFTQRFKLGIGIGPTIVDQINFQISCFENLHTPFARRVAAPMVDFMRQFMDQMAGELM